VRRDANIDDDGRYVIDDFHRRPPFASFLPGIAGPLGIPLWAFYVNRGQGMASFGVESKQSPIVEFQPANKAYQSVASLGFRTFLKLTAERRVPTFHEPFGAFAVGPQRPTQMCIGANDLEIREVAGDLGLETRVRYFSLPSEPFAALVRKVEITNVSATTLRGELLDGLPAIVPFGVDNWMLKEMSNTAVAWMGVENLTANIPFYRVAASIEDRPDVEEIDAGHFYLCFASTGAGIVRPTPIVDPTVVFGTNTAMSRPEPFLTESLAELLARPQIAVGRIPCGFFATDFALSPGEGLVVCSLVGHCDDIEAINRRADELSRIDYVDVKQAAARALADSVTRAVGTATSSRAFDLYVRQSCLDNVLRGGLPLVLRSGSEPHVCHLYARRHGDTERDYNAFSVPAEYYSEGNGAYRDANQNRRSDVLLEPDVQDHTVRTFMNLIQTDGYNPLELQSSTFALAEEDLDAVLALAEGDARLRGILSTPFTPGRVARAIETMRIRLKVGRDEFLDTLLRHARQEVQARHQEGYWIDHWTYNLDLMASYLAVYPDRREDFFFAERRLTFFDNPAVVAPRDERYVEVDGGVRQLESVAQDAEKAALIASRSASPNVMRSAHGRGAVYRTSLIAKLIGLCAIKFSTLDPYGMGVEMEAGKPGWDDAMNGLPALFGSSLSETYELRRLILLLADVCAEHPGATVRLACEVSALCRALAAALADRASGMDDFAYWDRVSGLRERYRQDTRLGFSGDEVAAPAAEFTPMLGAFRTRVDAGIARARNIADGLPPTYFVFEPVEWSRVTDAGGSLRCDAQGRPRVRIHAFAARPLPLFLEGVVKAVKLSPSPADAQALHRDVKESRLFDAKLGMYRLNASLREERQAIGRARAFTPGWLENESIFLHMHYKYLLALLTAGLGREFWAEVRRGLVPFFDPETYGRSILENSSFIVSSAHPDASLHGRGFVARLSGATAEFLSMWSLATVGPQPFVVTDEGLALQLRPELPAWLFRADGTLGFTFLGRVAVVYHNLGGGDLFSADHPVIRRIVLTSESGERAVIAQPVVTEPWASRIRTRQVTKIDVHFG
jgi:hypothetical protein